MTVRVANEVRAANMPIYCSACFGQNSDARHIDFDAACDRGYGDRDDGLKVSMDDLILCEDCVKSGAVLLGMMDTEAFQARLASLEHRLEEEKRRADKATEYADRMEQALSHRPQELKVQRPRGRPRLGAAHD
jgi:hypothetical protein